MVLNCITNVWIVTVQKCGKTFLGYCDRDSDTRISYQEWNFCLGGNTHRELVSATMASYCMRRIIRMHYNYISSSRSLNVH